ncbi:MAG: ATP-binding cassette domain-containing protein [Fibrobacteres bacterium]|nr:ATP-binding cassette domain-containing protein [Fibrobacterota bacterium]
MKITGRDKPLFALSRLDIPSGSRLLIEGPSGSGKSTFLHLLSGQFLPASGRISVGGEAITGMDEDARCRFRRRHFGILFQRFNLIGHLTALENTLVGLEALTREDRDRAVAALDRLGIAELRDRRAATLSPGESQRVAAARLLARPPDVILADEPTSSLDGPHARAVMDALCEAAGARGEAAGAVTGKAKGGAAGKATDGAAAGRTLIVVSHDPRTREHFDAPRDFLSLIDT